MANSIAHRLILGAVLFVLAGVPGVAVAADELADDANATATASADVPITQVLSKDDATRYRTIFRVQEKGDWATADKEIAALENDILMGYVLEQRYMHPTKYRSSFRELSRWMSAYADHPQATGIYRLARRRQGNSATPTRPRPRKWRTQAELPLHPDLENDYANSSRKRRVRQIENRLRYLCREGRPQTALNYLNAPAQFNALTRAQTDRARGWIAASFYHAGNLGKADTLAQEALERSDDMAVLSHWVAGLVDWRRGDYADAYTHFAKQTAIPYQDGPLRAAGAYWAARAATALERHDDAIDLLYVAADHPLTFYGQLALEQLGLDPEIDWGTLALDAEKLNSLYAASPRLKRAAALAQVGQMQAAELEFKWAQGETSSADDAYLIALAVDLSLPSAAVVLASNTSGHDKPAPGIAAGHFPLPDYSPSNGFKIDQAVLFGLIRQESKFLPTAKSSVGARGLMQLMPRTASYVAGTSRASGRLYDPAYNMQLGQSYVDQLLNKYNGGRADLFEMALSYNWGPGNFRRWKAKTNIDDQLLMLESVPNSEARHFVEVVMTNIWVYRDRLGKPAPSRARVAAGERPVYESVSGAR